MDPISGGIPVKLELYQIPDMPGVREPVMAMIPGNKPKGTEGTFLLLFININNILVRDISLII